MSLEQYENRIVRTCGKGTIAYELTEPDLFYMTGYKVIRNFSGGGLIAAYRSLLNGKIRLVYDIKDYVPILSVADEISPDRILELLQSLLSLCEMIKENGFIQGEHVCLDEDMIFTDEATGQVWLIYVPLRARDGMAIEPDGLEHRLVKFLSAMITAHPSLFDSRISAVREYLESGKCDIPHLQELLIAAAAQKADSQRQACGNASCGMSVPESLILERMGGNRRFVLRIPSSGAVIGRNEELAQILIPDSSVSKKHCRIYKDGSRWMIEDLKSSNHTWIGESQEWLMPYKESEIHVGETIRISRFVFQVKAGIGD